jgi:diguanylate cyclase (GGDEF)-like protein
MEPGCRRWAVTARKAGKVVIQEILLTTILVPPVARKTPYSPLRLLYIGSSLLIMIVVVTNIAVILQLRESGLNYEEGQLKNLSLIIAEQADRTFLSVNLAIASVVEGIVADGVTDVASFEAKVASHESHVLLREKLGGLPQLAAITVLNHEGKVINFSRAWPVPALDASDRTYFRILKEDPNLKRYMSEPVQNHATGTWVIFLAHRVSGAKGEFLGIILGAIEMQYFENFYQAISRGEGVAISLMRSDGIMIARFPQSDAVGTFLYASQHILDGNLSGTVREPSLIDGKMRIKTAHLVGSYPVLALATKTEEAALAEWRNIALLLSLAALVGAISIMVAAFAVGRQWKQQAALVATDAEYRRQLERTVTMTTAANVARAAAAELAWSAEHDTLTGLPNRTLLNDRINQAIALTRRHTKQVAVVCLGLDGFKHINDALGHSTGDMLLQSIATRLVTCVRRSDTVSRQGGDEFVVLLSEVEQFEGAAAATRRLVQAVTGPHSIDQHDIHVRVGILAGIMLQEIADPHSIEGHNLHVTASIGVSIYPDDGQDAEPLIQNANTAMYRAKEIGLHGCQFFKPEMNALAVERHFIEESLRKASAEHEFALHYQPVIDLTTGAIIGAEALIRWTHPTRGLIPPVQFISVAEDCGLIIPIGRWVLQEACRQAGVWVSEGLPVMSIAINVSMMEFREANFLTNLLAVLNETGLAPKSLVLEQTESILMKNAEEAVSILQTMRKTAVRVAIDDFGTGYSSLSYLRRFPVDILKIDQSFVRQIGATEEDRAILAAIISMAHSLKLRVIAEGVETLEELAFLRGCQCDEVQGYLFSRPVPAEEFAKLLRTGIPDPGGIQPRAGHDGFLELGYLSRRSV